MQENINEQWKKRFDEYFYDADHSLTPNQVAHIKKNLFLPILSKVYWEQDRLWKLQVADYKDHFEEEKAEAVKQVYEQGRKAGWEDQEADGIPMGVSEWKKYGKKFGYWEFFEKEARADLVEEIKELKVTIELLKDGNEADVRIKVEEARKQAIREILEEVKLEKKKPVKDEMKEGHNLARRIEGFNQACDALEKQLKAKL